MRQAAVWLFFFLAGLCAFPAWGSSESALSPMVVLEHMRAAYSQISEYQMDTEVKTFQNEGSFEVEKFVYSFRKPDHVRLDMETPHQGMVAIYPDKDGKVLVKHREESRFLSIRLRPDSSLLKGYPGHRIDHSDMGQLIEHIARSLTNEKRGPIDLSERDDSVDIRVLAVDHFRPDVLTLYEFFIDAKTWLPTGVTEMTPGGKVTRITRFRNMRPNPNLPSSFFDTDAPPSTGKGNAN